MEDSTLWWLAAGAAVIVELLTGTFYLLMLTLGLAAGALAAHAGRDDVIVLVIVYAQPAPVQQADSIKACPRRPPGGEEI